jgi:hypothetical protein
MKTNSTMEQVNRKLKFWDYFYNGNNTVRCVKGTKIFIVAMITFIQFLE